MTVVQISVANAQTSIMAVEILSIATKISAMVVQLSVPAEATGI